MNHYDITIMMTSCDPHWGSVQSGSLSTWNKCVSDTLALVRRDTQTHTRVHSTTLWRLLIGPLSHSPVCTTCPRSLFVSCQQQRICGGACSSILNMWTSPMHRSPLMVTFGLLKLKLVSSSNRAETGSSALASTQKTAGCAAVAHGLRHEIWSTEFSLTYR